MAVEVTAGVNLPQTLRRRPSLKLIRSGDIHFVHGQAIEPRGARRRFLGALDGFVPPGDSFRCRRVSISVIWVIQCLERRCQALRASCWTKLARVKGPLGWIRSSEQCRQSIELIRKCRYQLMLAGRDPQANVPVIG